MTQLDYITLYHHGRIHVIQREPFETNVDVYKRGWFIINHETREAVEAVEAVEADEADEADEAVEAKLQSISLIEIYKNKGMVYE